MDMQTDLEKARDIARRHGPFVGGDALKETIAKAIAEGISLGRSESAANETQDSR